jgi:hypothetical protein
MVMWVKTLISLIFTFAFLFSNGALAESTVLFVSKTKGSPAILDNEYEIIRAMAANLSTLLNQKAPEVGFKIVEILVNDLKELPEAIQKQISAEDTVSAIIFSGHGNKKMFSLHKNANYNGKQMAEFTFAALKDLHTTPDLTVYFHACSCAAPNGEKANLQTWFLMRMRELDLEGKWMTVNTMAHAELATTTPAMFAEEFTRYKRWFYLSKVPELLYALDMEILKTFGLKVLVYRSAVKAFLGGAAVGVGSYAFLQSIDLTLLPTVIGSGFFYVIAKVTDTFRSAWIKTRSLNQKTISSPKNSTIGSALEQFAKASRDCRRIYKKL